jgi:hypothetical protein
MAKIYPDDLTGKIETFWNFITENENNIFTVPNSESPLYLEIYNQIQLVDQNIFVMIGNEIENGKRNVIITCNGNPNYFELCDKIADLAPGYSYLNIISLFPPSEEIGPYIFGNIILKAEDVLVHFDGTGDISLLFILSHEHLVRLQRDNTGQLYNIYRQMLSMMVQELIGERIAGTRVKSVVISLVNIAIPSIPLIEIRNYIK